MPRAGVGDNMDDVQFIADRLSQPDRLSRAREKKIEELEASGDLVPTCRGCKEHYDWYRTRWDPMMVLSSMGPFAPRHKASKGCRSGGYPHCTCDTCF